MLWAKYSFLIQGKDEKPPKYAMVCITECLAKKSKTVRDT